MYPYSCFNKYVYHSKPQLIEAVDWLFYPVQTLFQGRTVNLLSGIEEVPVKSWIHSPIVQVASIVATVTLSFLFPAIGAALAVGVTLKGACFIWERKKVVLELSRISTVVEQFQKNYDSKKYIEALATLEEKPNLASQWKLELLEMATQLAKSNDTLHHLYKLCILYSSTDPSIFLFRHIIQTKFNKDMLNFNLKQIKEWIQNLNISNQEAIIYCFSALDIFKPRENDSLLIKIIKVNAGKEIIDFFQDKRKLDEFSYRNKILSESQLSNFDSQLFKDLLLDQISTDKLLYVRLLENPSDCQHLSFLVDGMRRLKAFESNLESTHALLNKKMDSQSPVDHYIHKKKIVSQARIFLQEIENLNFKNLNFQKHLPALDKLLLAFIRNKRKNAESSIKAFRNLFNVVDQLLGEGEGPPFDINELPAESDVIYKIYEFGEIELVEDNPIHNLYREYYTSLAKQFQLINKLLNLI